MPPTSTPVTPSPTPASSASPTATPAIAASPTITLTVWLPDTFQPYVGHVAANTMVQHLTAFANSQPDTYVNVRLKRASGSGGLLDLLRTASPVAPAALPDVVVLSLTDMQTAACLGILQPLDAWLADGLTADLFPFAPSAGQVDGKWYGLPYAIDLEHLAYDTQAFAAAAPLTWTHIVSLETAYLFPIGSAGKVLPDDVLVHYLANGGTLSDARGLPTLDEAPLADTLSQLLEAYQAGLIPPDALRYTSTDETWPTFAARKVPLANVRASQYLTAENSLGWLGYSALPGRSGPARPIARGWAFALTTRNPARQARAAALIMWMMAADRNAEWTQLTNLLPARSSALERWGRADPYALFLRQELKRAIAPPPTSVMASIGPVFQDALAAVLAGRDTPEAAAASAVTQLQSATP